MSKIPKIKAVIFDMDGLIIDTEFITSLSWEKLLSERGIKPIFKKNGLIHEVGSAGNIGYQKIIDQHGIKEDIDSIIKRRREIFEEFLKEKLNPLPGFLKLAEKLIKNKIKIAVASNRNIKHIYIILDNLGVKNLFQAIIGPNPEIKHKPAPDIYIKTAKNLKLKPDQCVALEDSKIGVLSAKKAKMKVIAVPNKYTQTHDFSKADKIVKSLSDITIKMINSL